MRLALYLSRVRSSEVLGDISNYPARWRSVCRRHKWLIGKPRTQHNVKVERTHSVSHLLRLHRFDRLAQVEFLARVFDGMQTQIEGAQLVNFPTVRPIDDLQLENVPVALASLGSNNSAPVSVAKWP